MVDVARYSSSAFQVGRTHHELEEVKNVHRRSVKTKAMGKILALLISNMNLFRAKAQRRKGMKKKRAFGISCFDSGTSKISQMPPEHIFLVTDFIDSLYQPNSDRMFTLADAKLSEPALQKV
jgi:hypothetical protein